MTTQQHTPTIEEIRAIVHAYLDPGDHLTREDDPTAIIGALNAAFAADGGAGITANDLARYLATLPTRAEATARRTISVNIGPGPNSDAQVTITGKVAAVASITDEEAEAIRDYLSAEDGASVRVIATWLGLTRDLHVALGGAHHEVVTDVDGDGDDEVETSYCVFCGDQYAWTVRCPANREGLV